MSNPVGAQKYGLGGGDAYYDAVRYGGYTGTREQFGRDQAEFAQNATAVAQAKEEVEQNTQTVVNTAQTFTEETVPAAIQSVEEKGDTEEDRLEARTTELVQSINTAGAVQVQAVRDEGTTQIGLVSGAGIAQVEAVEQAGSDQVDAVEQAGSTQVGNVNSAGTTQVGNVNSAGTTQVQAVNTAGGNQVQAVEDKGEEVLNSIPSDYTDLTEDVDNLKTEISTGKIFYKQATSADDWVNGNRAVNTGNGTDSTTRIRTGYFAINGNALTISCEDGYNIAVFAKNVSNTYIGVWIPETGDFAKTGTAIWQTEVNVSALIAKGAASISIVERLTTNSDILPAAGVNCYFMVASIPEIQTAIQNVPFLEETNEAFAYFTSNAQPTFTLESDSITVSKNTGNFRIYTNKGLFKTFTALGTHTITNVQKLVYDLDDDQIKVVAGTQSGNYILLLSFAGNNFNGILYPYYLKQQFENVNNRIDNVTDTSAENFALANVADGSDFKAVFFSDIHGASANMTSILSFASENASRVDAILNGGDTVVRWLNDTTYPLTWYTDAITASSIDILSAIGNHDAWDGTNFNKASAIDVYNAIIAPIVAKYSGIVQPSGAAENGLCYYYKDYGSKVRVIVLNAMDESTCNYWDNTQATWFTDVLADAKTNDLAVVCIEHAPYPLPISVRDTDAKNWSTWYPLETDGVKLETDAMDIVADFIENGGKFVCWLSGHLHEDNLLEATGYAGQIMLNIVTADAQRRSKVGVNVQSSSPYFDGFNYIGIDTTNGLLKVYRKGWNMDGCMKKHEYLCYDYVNHTIVAH